MSMTQDETTPTRAPKKKRGARRAKRAAPAAAKPKPTAILAGLTATDCAAGCNVAGCVISGKPYCAHPFKGGLRGSDMGNETAIGHLTAATRMLGKAKIKLDKL